MAYIKEPRCSTCKGVDDLRPSDTRKNKDGSVSQYYRCVECNRKRNKKTRLQRNEKHKNTDTSEYEVIHVLRCTTCGATDDLTAYTKAHSHDLRVTRTYYMCNPCNNKRRKKYYHSKEDKSYFIHVANEHRLRKLKERYEKEVVKYGRPFGWWRMNNRQKAKYLSDKKRGIK